MIEKSPKTEIDQAPGAESSGGGSRARLFEVEIAGVPLRLKSSHDERTVNELVAHVDHKIREALPLTKTGSIQNASILASLHLAEEYLNLKQKAQSELERLEAKTLKVISELESSRATGLQNNVMRSDAVVDVQPDAENTSAELQTNAGSSLPDRDLAEPTL